MCACMASSLIMTTVSARPRWRRCHAGEVLPVRCTLPYAPPEVVNAYTNSTLVTVEPGADIWALGVMAFEVLSGRRAMQSISELYLFASGAQSYPWEAAPDAAAEPWRKLRLWSLVEACLARDPAARPTAAMVVQRVQQTWQKTTM